MEIEIELKAYSNPSNARRAALAAKLKKGEFAIYKEGDQHRIRITATADEMEPRKVRKAKAIKAAKEPKAPKVAKAAKEPKVAKAPKAAASRVVVPSDKPGTKGAELIAMVTRGATISELMKTLGWLPHTTRGALSRLSTAGYNIQRTKVGAESHYKIAS